METSSSNSLGNVLWNVVDESFSSGQVIYTMLGSLSEFLVQYRAQEPNAGVEDLRIIDVLAVES